MVTRRFCGALEHWNIWSEIEWAVLFHHLSSTGSLPNPYAFNFFAIFPSLFNFLVAIKLHFITFASHISQKDCSSVTSQTSVWKWIILYSSQKQINLLNFLNRSVFQICCSYWAGVRICRRRPESRRHFGSWSGKYLQWSVHQWNRSQLHSGTLSLSSKVIQNREVANQEKRIIQNTRIPKFWVIHRCYKLLS